MQQGHAMQQGGHVPLKRSSRDNLSRITHHAQSLLVPMGAPARAKRGRRRRRRPLPLPLPRPRRQRRASLRLLEAELVVVPNQRPPPSCPIGCGLMNISSGASSGGVRSPRSTCASMRKQGPSAPSKRWTARASPSSCCRVGRRRHQGCSRCWHHHHHRCRCCRRRRQTTTNHHQPPLTTTNHHQPPPTTTNHQPPPNHHHPPPNHHHRTSPRTSSRSEYTTTNHYVPLRTVPLPPPTDHHHHHQPPHPPPLTNNQNLESEMSILREYQHTNIVKLDGIQKTRGHIFLILEFCAGGDLHK